MIQANELRIGNWVKCLFTASENEFNQITGVTEENIYLNALTWICLTYDNIDPIHLTEEILLDCGFEIKEGRFGNEYHSMSFVLYTSEKGSISFVWDNYIIDINHLHQLQNLMDDLKCPKLTYKPAHS